jgi:glycosyltransferase involved in cell wall biosynthesis
MASPMPGARSTAMRVVLACNFPRDEKLGSSRVPLRLAAELGKRGVDVTLVFGEDLPRGPGGRGDFLTAPFRMAAALTRRARDADVVEIAGFDGFAYARLARRLRPRQATVSRSNGIWDLGLDVADPAEALGRSPLHALLSDVYQRQVLVRWERASMEACDLGMFASRGDAREIVRRGWKTEDAVAAVNHGVDEFFVSPVPLAERRDVAFVGTYFYRKGCDIVARAMSAALRARPGLRLSLFGTGVAPADVLAGFDAEVRPRVTVHPPLSAGALAEELARFAIFFFPTRYEGFGMVVPESMRAGLAVVTTPTGAGLDVVRDGENGLLVPIGSAEAGTAAVLRLVDDDALRVRLATRAVADTKELTWARAAGEAEAAYERAIARAARRAS